MLPETKRDNRRLRRVNLPLPVRVEHKASKDASFSEFTRLIDVSAFGAGFNLPLPLKRGRLILMTMPLARPLRNYDFNEPQYKVWGLVRHCIPVRRKTDEIYAIGTAFIGKHPPKSYLDDPAKLYDITKREGNGFWNITAAPAIPDESAMLPADCRHTRYNIPIEVTLETLDDAGNVVTKETTVTENISLGGASVFTTLSTEVGAFLRLASRQYNSTITAIVRGRRCGTDGISRLHLEFFDHYFPLDGI